jgi:hypothetical protein
MKCPSCGNNIPDDAIKCKCGYSYTTYTKTYYKIFNDMSGKEFFFNSFRIYGVALGTFLLLGAIYSAVSLGLELTVGEAPSTVSSIITLIAYLIAQIVTYMALLIAAHKVSDGEDIGILESYALSFSRFGRFVWTGFLYILIVLGGMILLIIPGIIWGIKYFYAPYAVIVEGIGGKEAFSRSKALTKDRLWEIGWREFVFGLLFFLIIWIPIFALIFLIGAIIHVIGVSEINPMWAGAISSFGDIISQGLFVIFNVLLFKSLREELPLREIILEETTEKQRLREKLIRELKDACPYCKFNLKSGKDTCEECGKVFFEPAQEM